MHTFLLSRLSGWSIANRLESSKKGTKIKWCLSWDAFMIGRGMASMVESQSINHVNERAAEMAKEDEKISRKRTRRERVEIQTPGTLPQYRDAKKYLSVTDFVSPLWCEYAFHYGILGLRHLPVSQRPKEIETPSGHIIKPDKQVAQQREKVLVGGRKVHEKLEKEIHPVKVRVQTTTREDEWALRILRLITGLKTLLSSGCCREIPIFGFVHGELVMGVVDEINRRPLSKRLNKYLDEAAKESQAPASQTISDFFTPVHHQGRSSSQSFSSDGQKKYSSQEEWKKEMRRKEALAKSSKKAPKKSPTKPKQGIQTGQGSLATFFGGKKDAHNDTTMDVEEAVQLKERYGYFLEDSKTRLAKLLPPLQDQKPARLQCMLYKRLFDGLLSGMVGGSAAHTPTKEQEVLELDENATSFDLAILFAHQSLNAQAPLSDGFTLDAEGLLSEFDLSIRALDQACTLKTVADLLSDTLTELTKSAQEGLGWRAADGVASGVIQHHLRLTYRKRRGKFHSRGKYTSEARRTQPSRSAKRQKGFKEEQEAVGVGKGESLTNHATGSNSGTIEDRSVAIALDLGLDDDIRQAEIEDEVLRDNGIVIPDSSPSVPLSQRRGTEDTETDATPLDKNILGTVDFYHNPIQLDNHLHDMMLLWNGERSMRGVTLEQSWRCHKCEFRQDCEWRQEKGQEELDKAMQKRLDQAAQQIDQQPIGPSDSDGSSSDDEERQRSKEQKIVDSRSSSQSNYSLPQKVYKEDLDDEDALWSQFEDIETEQLKD